MLGDIVREHAATMPLNEGKRRLYYLSAEFLIGRLLTNNLIELGVYDDVKAQLAAAGHDLGAVEEREVEPSLGNGGLGRLAACFLDSIATLGLPGDGVGLNYHYGLFHQRFVDLQQAAEPDGWLDRQDWLVKDEKASTVGFGGFTVKSRLYDIDVLGYGRTTRTACACLTSEALTTRWCRRSTPSTSTRATRQEPHALPLPRRLR